MIKEEALKIKAKTLFEIVGNLFTADTLAPDFEAKDVQLGHSYFLVDNEEELQFRLKYEIKPILREYIKDGILLGKSIKNLIESLHV